MPRTIILVSSRSSSPFALRVRRCASAGVHADRTLIDAAKKEGSVTWYTTQIIDQFARPAADAFEKKYGIKVNYVRAGSADGALRIINEVRAGKVQADVVDGTDIQALIKMGALLDYVPDSAKALPAQFIDPQRRWVATNIYSYAFGYNTDLVPKGTEPKTYEDLLDPKWKGKMAWSERPSTSSAPGMIGVVLAGNGRRKRHGLSAQARAAEHHAAHRLGARGARSSDFGRICDRARDHQQPCRDQRGQGRSGRLVAADAVRSRVQCLVDAQGRAAPKCREAVF